jgi:glutathione S-transferase
METALSKRPYLASTGFGIADIALFAYTHDAPAAGIALDDFPHVTQWLARVRAQPGFVPQ